jgi:hypothetical protein
MARRSLNAWITLGSLLLVAGLLLLVPVGARAEGSCALGQFGAGNLPCADWRPYSDSSPFNTRIGAHPQVVSNSQGIVDRLNRGGPINSLVAGDPDRGKSPTFWSTPDDPAYKIECASFGTRCEVSGMEINIPKQAVPQAGYARLKGCDGCSAEGGDWDHDAHMTVVDQSSGWEYDFWGVQSKANGRLVVGWGGRTRIDGDGLGSGGVAAGFGNLAGIIRAPEFVSGHIDHALTIAAPCVTGTTWPATGSAWDCARHGMPTANRLELGSRVQLQISDAALARLPTWQRGIARALRDYGAYVNDTTGEESQWGASLENPGTYTDFGHADPAASATPSDDTGDYNHNGYRETWFSLSKRIDWSKLRVLAPCDPSAGCDEGPPPSSPPPEPSSQPSPSSSASSSARRAARSASAARAWGRSRSNRPRSARRSRAVKARQLAGSHNRSSRAVAAGDSDAARPAAAGGGSARPA